MIDESDLLRFIEGDCTPEEAIAIQQWLSADPRRAQLLDDLRAMWRLTGGAGRRWDTAAARARLGRGRLRLIPRAAPFWASNRPLRIAVATGLAVAAGTFWLLGGRAPSFREYATARGQVAEITLPDSSRVMLSVDSRLRVPAGYAARERVVDLEGEAYFVVRHVPDRPFLVRTAHGVAEDLGTEFNVRSYGPDDRMEVVVAAGRVALHGAGRPDTVLLTLGPRARGVIGAQGDATLEPDVPVEAYTAWMRRRLAFDDAPLSSVIEQMERWYAVDIETADSSLLGERLTISFTTESLDEALRAVALVLDVRVIRTGGTVRLVRDLPQH